MSRANTNEKLCEQQVPPKTYKRISLMDPRGQRNMLIARRHPVPFTKFMPTSQLEKLKRTAHIVTAEDRRVILAEAERKKNQDMNESMERKRHLQQAQVTQHGLPGSNLFDVENDAKAKTQYLLGRAIELIQEQDERVKKANGMILATKCHLIRTAQIVEKRVIKDQLKEENHRLDMMMEQKRQEAIRLEDEKLAKANEKKRMYKDELNSQIRSNEIARMVEAEKKEEEAKRLNQALLEMQKDDFRAMAEKREKQQKVNADLKLANEELEKFKFRLMEEERIAELRAKKFLDDKEERERKAAEEKRLLKEAQEREKDRLRAIAEGAQGQQAMMDEMNAFRAQEEVEKEWRRKELIEAKKKKEAIEELLRGRSQQILDIKKAIALTLAKEEQDFQRIVKLQKEMYVKEQEKKRQLVAKNVRHRKEILKQIDDKERERIAAMKERFEEGALQRLEDQIKANDINKYLRTKMEKIRTQLPESYVHEIEAALHLTEDTCEPAE